MSPLTGIFSKSSSLVTALDVSESSASDKVGDFSFLFFADLKNENNPLPCQVIIIILRLLHTIRIMRIEK